MLMAQVLAGLLVDKLTPAHLKPGFVKLLLLVVVTCYLYYSPWIYAFPLTNEGHARRRWLPRWD
jgi:dolichyl-phosphate-mannose--protein O-mannosyl transferase